MALRVVRASQPHPCARPPSAVLPIPFIHPSSNPRYALPSETNRIAQVRIQLIRPLGALTDP